MTIVLPPLLALLGIVLGGVLIGVAVGALVALAAVLLMGTRTGSWLAAFAVPVGLLSAVAGGMWLSGFL